MVRDHPLAGRSELRLRDCLAYPLALGDATLAGRALIEQVLAQASFDLDPRLVSNSVETMKAFARMNRGVCFQFRKPGKAHHSAGRHGRAAADRSAAAAGKAYSGDPPRTRAADCGRRVRRTAQSRSGVTAACAAR